MILDCYGVMICDHVVCLNQRNMRLRMGLPRWDEDGKWVDLPFVNAASLWLCITVTWRGKPYM
jgi:hypothetical protein